MSSFQGLQRREFHKALLDADAFEDPPGKWQAADRARAPGSRARRSRGGQGEGILARVERDYEAGDLSASTYEHQQAKQTEAMAAADAEHERLSRHADEIAEQRDGFDTESEVWRRLAKLRANIASAVGRANGDVDALRAALTQVFEAVYVVPVDSLYRRDDDAHDELHERLNPERGYPGDNDDAALVLEAGPDGLRELKSDALALVPVVRKSMLTDAEGLPFPRPIKPLSLSGSGRQSERHPGARPDQDEQPIERVHERPAHADRG